MTLGCRSGCPTRGSTECTCPSFPYSVLTLPLGLGHVLLPVIKPVGGLVQPGHANTQDPLCYLLVKEEQSWFKIWNSCPQAHVSPHRPARSYRALCNPRNLGRGWDTTLHHLPHPELLPGGPQEQAEVVQPRAALAPWEAPRPAGQKSWEEPGVCCWHGHMQVTGFQLVRGSAPTGKGQQVLLSPSLNQHPVSRWKSFSEVRHSERGWD